MYLCSSLFRFCDKNKSNEKGRIPSEEADLNFRDAKKFYRTPIIRIIQRYGMDKAFRREIRREMGTIQHVRMSPVEKLMAKRRGSRKNSKGQSCVWTAIGKSTHIHFVNVPFGGKGRR